MRLVILASAFCALTSSAFSTPRKISYAIHNKAETIKQVKLGESQLDTGLLKSHLSIEFASSHLAVPDEDLQLIRLGGRKKKAPPITTIDAVLNATIKSREVSILPSMKMLGAKDETQAMCLALNIYHEARGSTDDDQMGVGFVTLNRSHAMDGKLFGDTICKVVGQRLSRSSTPQFSWLMQPTNELIPHESDAWAKSQFTALRLYTNCKGSDDGCWKDVTGGALFFWNPDIAKTGSWMKWGSEYTKLGSHMYMSVSWNLPH